MSNILETFEAIDNLFDEICKRDQQSQTMVETNASGNEGIASGSSNPVKEDEQPSSSSTTSSAGPKQLPWTNEERTKIVQHILAVYDTKTDKSALDALKLSLGPYRSEQTIKDQIRRVVKPGLLSHFSSSSSSPVASKSTSASTPSPKKRRRHAKDDKE